MKDSPGMEGGQRVLCLCLTQTAWYLQERSVYLIWSPNFCGSTKWTPVEHLAEVASGAYTHGFHNTVTNRKSSYPATLPSAQQENKLRSCLSVKEAY